MKKTFNCKNINGRQYNLLTLPDTNLFKFEIVNLLGSNIERVIEQTENKNVYGISHLIEHLGFRCPKDYTTEELMEALKVHGTYNASTDHDRINYWFKTISDKSATAINIVCNYALNDLTGISKDEFETEKKVVYNEAKRYADDDQTMFYFNSVPSMCGYNEEDNVIGIPETINTFTLDDAIKIKNIFLTTGEQVYNITYDNTVFTEDEIIAQVEAELERWKPQSDPDYYAKTAYNNMLQSPTIGEFFNINESEQVMTMVTMDVIDNIIVARLANNYLGHYSETSLDDIIREKNGLTYGVSFYDDLISYKPYTIFACDVTEGTEDLLMELFKDSINQSIDNFTEITYNKLMDTNKLKRVMRMVNQQNYDHLHWMSIWYPYIIGTFEKEFNLNVEVAFNAIDAEVATYENIKKYLEKLRVVVNNKTYSIVTNKETTNVINSTN